MENVFYLLVKISMSYLLLPLIRPHMNCEIVRELVFRKVNRSLFPFLFL